MRYCRQPRHMARSRVLLLLLGAVALARAVLASTDGLKIKELHMPDNCEGTARPGLYVGVHYVGKLEDGTEFDNSYDRGREIEFQLGSGQVIAGWDEGINGMCLYEKRRLTIPSHLAYGDEGIGPIPGGATLEFDVELIRISVIPQQEDEGEEAGYEAYAAAEGELAEEEEEGEQVLGEINFGEDEWSEQ